VSLGHNNRSANPRPPRADERRYKWFRYKRRLQPGRKAPCLLQFRWDCQFMGCKAASLRGSAKTSGHCWKMGQNGGFVRASRALDLPSWIPRVQSQRDEPRACRPASCAAVGLASLNTHCSCVGVTIGHTILYICATTRYGLFVSIGARYRARVICGTN
jgi:hypothetical protein